MALNFKNKKIDLPKFIGADDSDTAVLFIHGLGGSCHTWCDFASHLNETWDGIDSFSLEYDEYYKRYSKIPIISQIMVLYGIFNGKNISMLSEHLKSVISENCSDYENVIIVCHSMGGLIARKYLVDKIKKDKHLGKIKCLITYATPHHGSFLGNFFSIIFYHPLKFLFISKLLQVHELSQNSSFIQNLNKDWSDLRVEDKIDFIRVVGMQDWVVRIKSAQFSEHDENVRPVANKDHFNIIKPLKDIKDVAFQVTFNYLKKFRIKLEREKELLESQEEYS